MAKLVTCTVPNAAKAETVVTQLRGSDFASSDISVLFAKNDKNNVILEKHTKAAEGAATGGGTGVVVGGVLGWLAGIGSLAIPGVGPFVAAGPIMAALGGGAVGATVGGVLGSLVGLGVPEIEAKNYESKLKDGEALVSVHTDDTAHLKRARDIFKANGANSISEVKTV